VAALDFGIDTNHPDLWPHLNLELSRSFVDEPLQYRPGGLAPFAHGSAMAGIIAAADDGAGTIGVAPEAEIVHLKVGRDVLGGTALSAKLAAITLRT